MAIYHINDVKQTWTGARYNAGLLCMMTSNVHEPYTRVKFYVYVNVWRHNASEIQHLMKVIQYRRQT